VARVNLLRRVKTSKAVAVARAAPVCSDPTFPGSFRSSASPHPSIVVFNHAFFLGNIFPKITRITSGRCSSAEPSSV
jgi:hypothetical protein